jgi:cyclic pyranopterin phosphate synthase
MRDRFGREIGYARISITDRCNLRCVYCMPEAGVKSLRHADILSYESILRICRVFAALGIRKLRVTGGEPLVRKGAASLIARLKELEEGVSVTLTTNGLLLPEMARELRESGLDGVNVSLDARDPSVYRRLTRGGDVHRVLAGIDAAAGAGIPLVKVNCVPLGEESREDALQVASLARDRPIHVRFIEMMPVGSGAAFAGVDNGRLRGWLEREYGSWTPLEDELNRDFGSGPARYGSLPGFRGKIGFISSISECFCESCNRIRLTATGLLRPCLNRNDGVSLLPALASPDDGRLSADIRGAILDKPERHDFVTRKARGKNLRGTMSKIGG